MDTSECQPLYLDIQVFYESINMKVEQKIPLLLVERQALNEAMDGERNVSSQHSFHHSILHTTKQVVLSVVSLSI